MNENTNQILHAYLLASRQMSMRSQGYLGKLNLTYPQAMTLMILDADGPMPISELAKASGSANSTTSGVVDRLERMGLAKRVRSEDDHRKIYVAVTDQYLKIRRETEITAGDRFAQSLKNLKEEELQIILQGLKLLAQALEQE